MDLTPQELRTLRDIVIRAVSDGHEVLANAARRSQAEGRRSASLILEAAAPSAQPTQAPTAKLAYSINDASAALGLSRSTLYNLIGTGELRAIRIAGRRLIAAADIGALLSRAVTKPV